MSKKKKEKKYFICPCCHQKKHITEMKQMLSLHGTAREGSIQTSY